MAPRIDWATENYGFDIEERLHSIYDLSYVTCKAELGILAASDTRNERRPYGALR